MVRRFKKPTVDIEEDVKEEAVKEEVKEQPTEPEWITKAKKSKDPVVRGLAELGYPASAELVRKDKGDHWRVITTDAMKHKIQK